MYKRILVAIDGSEVSNEGLKTAAELAQRFEAELIVAHAIDEDLLPMHHGGDVFVEHDKVRDAWHRQGQAIIAEARRRLETKGLHPETLLLESDTRSADEQIARAVTEQKADLLVVGSHGRRGLQRFFLGSVAEKLARKVDCAIFIVKSGGGVS